jgi:hypothetical protein
MTGDPALSVIHPPAGFCEPVSKLPLTICDEAEAPPRTSNATSVTDNTTDLIFISPYYPTDFPAVSGQETAS